MVFISGIAGQLFGDPYLWPQLWEANQYILDAHWIYRGPGLWSGWCLSWASAIHSRTPADPVCR